MAQKRKLVLLCVSFYLMCGTIGFLFLRKEGIIIFQQHYEPNGKGSIIRRQENNCVLPILSVNDPSISRLIKLSPLPQCDPITEDIPSFATLVDTVLEITPLGLLHCSSLQYREIHFSKGDSVNKIMLNHFSNKKVYNVFFLYII